MRLQLIRNATMRFEYGSAFFVTDPLLAEKLTMPSYSGKSRNPLVDLPILPERVLLDAEMVLLSHIHSDHFDKVAQQTVNRDLKVFCQPCDLKRLGELGFKNVYAIEAEVSYKGIRIVRTEGRHGSGTVLEEMGPVSGYVLLTPTEPTVYWVGDSVLYEGVLQTIDRYKPDVILTHSSGAVWGRSRELIVMDAAQTVQVCRYCPDSTIVAVHMDALDHGTVTRSDLARAREDAHIRSSALQIPQDGETLTF
jgi:L-ascorbate metabolism protein UlaG (beta-lactamase superfamily)